MTDSENWLCLDLFSGLGGFSQSFADSDEWDIFTVDVESDHGPDLVADVLGLRPSTLIPELPYHPDEADLFVVLAGHPCTYFTTARNLTKGGDPAWRNDEPRTDDARDHLCMIYHTEGLIRGLSPDYWILENPRGMLRKRWKEPVGTVWFCQYDAPTAKPTDLWGEIPPTFEFRTCHTGNDDCHHAKTESYELEGEVRDGSISRQGILTETDSSSRSKIPLALSESLREAVESAYLEPPPEQTTLAAATDGGEGR